MIAVAIGFTYGTLGALFLWLIWDSEADFETVTFPQQGFAQQVFTLALLIVTWPILAVLCLIDYLRRK